MPSSDLAYRALYSALDQKTKALQRPHPARPEIACPQLHDDVFVETGGVLATHVYMFLVRATTTFLPDQTLHHRYGVFANVDKRCATAPRLDTMHQDTVQEFLAALPPISLHAKAGDKTRDGVAYEVRVRNLHVDITMHFANPRPPRSDLVALATAIRQVIEAQTT
ncbi:MAG TPA: hypothetical protein VFQ53_16860 [Kofleriaceae bacterium]|nr:hypothetical protein [Kofleriaceae bacterium]